MKKDKIIIIIFMAFLILPNILYLIFKNSTDLNNYENRELYEFPGFSLNNITSFPMNFENYFNDNLPFKNEIRKIRSELLYKVFNIGSNSRVIVGDDGWLFYNGVAANDGDSIADYRKTSKYTLKEMQIFKDSLLKTNEELKKKNKSFYILVVPNKENVYSDKLEAVIKRSNNELSRTESLIKYLKNETELNIIYPKEQLINNRINGDTYFKYDTHWNKYGAYLGMMALMNEIDNSYVSPEIKISYNKYSGDLSKMNMSLSNVHDEPIIDNFYDDSNVICKIIDNYEYCANEEAKYNKTIVFVGDSFREMIKPFISKLFTKSIIIHRNNYNQNLIDNYNADIVIYETVERYSYSVNNTSMFLK